jgi:hypothetical protein
VTPEQLRADPWAFGPWCHHVDEVRLLVRPIPARGMQGRWPLSHELRVAMQLQLDVVVTNALTLLQPYASAIAIGPKRMIVPPGGLWLGLHAGKELYGGPEYAAELLADWRCACIPGPRSGGAPPDGPSWPTAPNVAELPLGVLLGAMHVAGSYRYPDDDDQPALL